MDITQIKPDDFVANSKSILEILNGTDKQRIPMLNNIDNLNVLHDGQLVRFRGLVQDMLDPQIYLESYEVVMVDGSKQIKCGKYRDQVNLDVSI